MTDTRHVSKAEVEGCIERILRVLGSIDSSDINRSRYIRNTIEKLEKLKPASQNASVELDNVLENILSLYSNSVNQDIIFHFNSQKIFSLIKDEPLLHNLAQDWLNSLKNSLNNTSMGSRDDQYTKDILQIRTILSKNKEPLTQLKSLMDFVSHKDRHIEGDQSDNIVIVDKGKDQGRKVLNLGLGIFGKKIDPKAQEFINLLARGRFPEAGKSIDASPPKASESIRPNEPK